jgi:hypothetical protein
MYVGLLVSTHYSRPILMKSDFFSTDFRKNTQTPNCMKIRPVGAKLFDTDRRADMTKLIIALHNFANASKTLTLYREVIARGFITL